MVAVHRGVATHTVVSHLALVVIVETGRVYLETIFKAALLHEVTDDGLRHRRATDIAETDEEELGHYYLNGLDGVNLVGVAILYKTELHGVLIIAIGVIIDASNLIGIFVYRLDGALF